MHDRLSQLKEREAKWWDQRRDGPNVLPLVDVEEVHRTLLQPCYTTGSDYYSDNKRAFHQIIHANGGWAGKHVLDYACGIGTWAVYYALTGASKVMGFDLSETSIRRGCERVKAQGLTKKVKLRVMDAANLEYPDNTFDIVIGHAVIHHVIKYPGIFEELYRVMKPGTKAYFLEGLADFPLFKLWWILKGEVPQGDVPIFSWQIYEKTRKFSHVEIYGDSFIYSLKAFLWKENLGTIRRFLLKACKKTDNLLFAICPSLRRWGDFSYIVLTK